MNEPDVSVVVPVYNTVEHVGECLASLAGQTLAAGQVEVIVVDDGSTDGSREILQSLAQQHTEWKFLWRDSNSGTPAVPFNQGLEAATGRYVFFLGSDDYLAPEALETLVSAADEWSSDVIFSRIVAVGGHSVATRVYQHGTSENLDLADSKLPWALSNSKLFRRSLIEEHGIRYLEDMRQRCDQPFTLSAMAQARKVSLLAEADLYFARLRGNRTNVTVTADVHEAMYSTRRVADTMAELFEPGEQRDNVMARIFDVDVRRLIGASFADLLSQDKADVIACVQELSEDYLTTGLAKKLPVVTRVRVFHARAGDTDRLIATQRAIADFNAGATVPLVLRDGCLHVAYPGFAEGSLGSWVYRVGGDERVTTRVCRAVSSVSWRSSPRHLKVRLRAAIAGLEASHVKARLASSKVKPKSITVTRLSDDTSNIEMKFALKSLPATPDRLQLTLVLGKQTYKVFPEVEAGATVASRKKNAVASRVPCLKGDAEGRLVIGARGQR